MGLLKKIFTWWDGATIGTALFNWRNGVRVGADSQGNVYFHSKKGDKRWVMYNGANDASRVPPEWHGWLHGSFDDLPQNAQDYVLTLEKMSNTRISVIGGAAAPVGGGSLAGNLLILGGALSWAAFTVLLKPYTHRVHGIQLSAITMVGGAIPLILWSAPEIMGTGWMELPGSAWGAIMYSGFLALVVAYLIYYHGVRMIGPTRTAMYANLQPLIALLVVPLPAILLDLFLATAIGLSVVVLLVALHTTDPLEFSSFPALLLLLRAPFIVVVAVAVAITGTVRALAG